MIKITKLTTIFIDPGKVQGNPSRSFVYCFLLLWNYKHIKYRISLMFCTGVRHTDFSDLITWVGSTCNKIV